MKKIKLLIFTLLSFSYAFAQQLPNVSYFMYDQTRTNAGSIGSKDMICASLIGKYSMTGFEGAPENVYANIGVPFKLFGAKHGVGLSFYNDKIGFYDDIDIKLSYAFRFNVAEGTLGIGVDGSYRQKKLDGSKWNYDVNGDASDPTIPQGQQDNINGFGVGFGLFYRSEDIYLGASVTNIYAKEIKYNTTSTGGGTATEQLMPHYYVTAGYNFQLSNPAFEIEPAVQFYTDGVSTTFDLNTILTYNKRIWGGVSYRAGSAVVAMAGFMMLDGVRVGVAYDYYTSAISQHSNGGIEVLINYCFKVGVEKSPQRYRSIRYL